MLKIAIKCAFFCFFVCSCVSKDSSMLQIRKKIPESNQMFLISSKQDEISNEDVGLKVSTDKSFFNNPRQNISARYGGVITSSFDNVEQNSISVKQNESVDVFEIKANQKKEKIDTSYQINDYAKPSLAVENIKSSKPPQNARSVVLDEYQDENDAISHAIAATKYTSEKFNVKQMPNGKFAVKLDGVEKKKAYAVANLGLKIGYENIRVVY